MGRHPAKRDSRKSGGKGFFPRKSRKACEFCIDRGLKPDYKNVQLLNKYVSDRGKIKPRRMTGCCARHQRKVTIAIKRAREIALIPYAAD
ncbi:MAG: 30S ribosomal protein S18 [bacterium]